MSEVAVAGATIDLVVFRVAGHLFGVEACQVRGSRPADGNVSGMLDAECLLLGLPPAPPVTTRWLLRIKGDPEDWELCVDAPLELCRLEAAAVHRLPDLVGARTGLRQLRALALSGKEVMSLVDLRGGPVMPPGGSVTPPPHPA